MSMEFSLSLEVVLLRLRLSNHENMAYYPRGGASQPLPF